MKLQRYDRSLINDYRETPEGYLTVKVPITRPGVFPYQRQDGTVQMEAKLPDEIFSDRTIESARSKPVTDEHPNEPVTLDNYTTYAKGMSHTDAKVKDLKLYVSLTITDKELIQKIYDGKNEISIGFMSDVVAEKGTYNGQAYEYVQRNIEINHIAIVEQGRAGPEVAIRSDSAAWQIENEGGNNVTTYKIDGKEYQVDSVVKSHIEKLQAQLEAAQTKATQVDALQARCDGLETQLQKTENELTEAKAKQLSEDEVHKKVEARVGLITTVKPLLGDSFDFTGKTERDIKQAVITAFKADFKGDDKSDEYINALYDFAVEQAQSQGFSSTGTNTLITGDSAGATKDVAAMRSQRLNLRDE